MKNEKTFWEWYVETSKTAGSLVTPSSAARMVGTSRAYMDKLASTGKIQNITSIVKTEQPCHSLA